MKSLYPGWDPPSQAASQSSVARTGTAQLRNDVLGPVAPTTPPTDLAPPITSGLSDDEMVRRATVHAGGPVPGLADGLQQRRDDRRRGLTTYGSRKDFVNDSIDQAREAREIIIEHAHPDWYQKENVEHPEISHAASMLGKSEVGRIRKNSGFRSSLGSYFGVQFLQTTRRQAPQQVPPCGSSVPAICKVETAVHDTAGFVEDNVPLAAECAGGAYAAHRATKSVPILSVAGKGPTTTGGCLLGAAGEVTGIPVAEGLDKSTP